MPRAAPRQGEDQVLFYPQALAARAAGRPAFLRALEDQMAHFAAAGVFLGFAIPIGMLITVLRRASGEGHAVLTVRTDQGDVILDNLNDVVMNWDETSYNFLKRQSTTHTGRWVTIREGEAPLVGSLH